MLPARLAALLRPRLTLVLHQHSDFSAGRRPGIRVRLRRAGLCCIDALLGRRLRQIYVNEAMPRGKNSLCIRNALAPNRFTDELWDRERTRRALGLPDGTAFALLFGWSPHIKGVDVAAEALRLLHAAGHTEFVLGVVGGRAYPEERLRAYIAETTGCTGQEAYLRFLPPLEDVFRYHRAADVMLSASRSEAFPYSILVSTPFALYIFFALIAFIPALRYMKTGERPGPPRCPRPSNSARATLRTALPRCAAPWPCGRTRPSPLRGRRWPRRFSTIMIFTHGRRRFWRSMGWRPPPKQRSDGLRVPLAPEREKLLRMPSRMKPSTKRRFPLPEGRQSVAGQHGKAVKPALPIDGIAALHRKPQRASGRQNQKSAKAPGVSSVLTYLPSEPD